MQVGLLKAIRFFGTQKALAKILGVKQQAISNWLNRQNNIPYPHVIKIVCATKGYITPEELAPNHTLNESILGLIKLQQQDNKQPITITSATAFNENIYEDLSQCSVEYRESFKEKFQRKNIQRKVMNKLHIKNYVKISTRYWMEIVDKKMKRLGSDAIIVSFYLQTCPHANRIGVYSLALSYVAYDTGLSQKKVLAALKSLEQLNFCSYDEEKEYIWVHEMALNQISAQLNANDKRIKLIDELYHCLPELAFLKEFYHFYKERFFLTPRKE